ncbi:MAG: hypothetical protein WKH64_09370 [Chloroflexia bacterium]
MRDVRVTAAQRNDGFPTAARSPFAANSLVVVPFIALLLVGVLGAGG